MKMRCARRDKNRSEDGDCCDRCPAGEHVKSHCWGTKPTECAKCGRGFFTATENYLPKCHACKDCSSNNRQSIVRECTATQNTVCGCQASFYCSNDDCDHCEPVAQCHPGEGVTLKATRTNNTVCAPCKDGTFNNVTDFLSPCKAHTRCEDYGRELQSAGTPTRDAVCGNFKSHCAWLLPAGLWSGLALTVAVVLLVLVLWRAKRKSHRTVNFSQAVVKEFIPAPLPPPPPTHCQESCKMEECKLSIYSPDDSSVSCATQDSSGHCPLKIPLGSSDSVSECNLMIRRCSSSNLLRLCSEPQEDEWCGT